MEKNQNGLGIVFWNIQKQDFAYPNIEQALIELMEGNHILVLIEPEKMSDFLIEMRLGLIRVNPILKNQRGSRFLPRIYTKPEIRNSISINSMATIQSALKEGNPDEIDKIIGSRVSAFSLSQDNGTPNILFVAVHLLSKISVDEIQSAMDARTLANYIRELERALGSKSVVFGDFNMHPFSIGLMEQRGFYCSPSVKDVELNPNRFYNPSYNLLGDYIESSKTTKPPGSFYFEPNSQKDYLNWSLFDQVILRKEIVPHFDFSKFEIITSTKSINLKSDISHRPSQISDHFPIRFFLNL